MKNLKLQVSGPCASGFGACCVLYTSTCGGTIPHNTTYIRHNINLQYHLHQAQYLTIPTIPYIKIFTKNGRLRGNFTRNPEYPSTYNAESSCTWTVPKIQSDVCHIRWDCKRYLPPGFLPRHMADGQAGFWCLHPCEPLHRRTLLWDRLYPGVCICICILSVFVLDRLYFQVLQYIR